MKKQPLPKPAPGAAKFSHKTTKSWKYKLARERAATAIRIRNTAREVSADPWSHLTPAFRIKAQAFIAEYVKDFHGVRAALRANLATATSARAFLNNMMGEPYVQYLLEKIVAEGEFKGFVSRQRVLAGLLREANSEDLKQGACSATRIKAWSCIGKLIGMEVIKVETNVKIEGKVLLVPATATPAEWEAMALAHQTGLITDARNTAPTRIVDAEEVAA